MFRSNTVQTRLSHAQMDFYHISALWNEPDLRGYWPLLSAPGSVPLENVEHLLRSGAHPAAF